MSRELEILARAQEIVGSAVAHANLKLKGRRVRIVSDFNDQPYGRSRPSLKGKVTTISHVCVESSHSCFFLEGYLCSVRPNEVEFLEDE